MTVIAFDYQALAPAVHPPPAPVRGGGRRHAQLPRAAERCHVSQPSLSAQLAQLEGALGVRLFERDRRRVLLTAAGRALVERAPRRAAGDGRPGRRGHARGRSAAGRLQIGVIPTISPYLLPTAAPALRRAHPKLTVVWRRGQDGRPRARPPGRRARRRAARAGGRPRRRRARGDRTRPVRAGHAAAPSARRPGRADGAVRAARRAGAPARRRPLLPRPGAGGVPPRAGARGRVPRHQPLHAGADGGRRRGVTLLPELAVPTETGRTSLRVRRLAEPAPHRTIGLVWRRGYPLAGALREVAATIRAAYPTAGHRKS